MAGAPEAFVRLRGKIPSTPPSRGTDMQKLWGVLRHNWGKALVAAIIGTALTLANVPPAIIGTIAKAGSDAAADYAEEKHKEEMERGENGNSNADDQRGGRSGADSNLRSPGDDAKGQPADSAESQAHRKTPVAGCLRVGCLRELAFNDPHAPGVGSSGGPLVLAQLLEPDPCPAQLLGRPSFARVHILNEAVTDPERLPGAPRNHTEHAHLQKLTAGFVHPGASGPALGGAQAAASDPGGKTGRHFTLMAS